MLSDISNKIVQYRDLWTTFIDKFKVKNPKEPNVVKEKQKIIEKFFVGMNVITNYGDNFKRYRIEGVDFNQYPTSKFPNKKFENYLEYYER